LARIALQIFMSSNLQDGGAATSSSDEPQIGDQTSSHQSPPTRTERPLTRDHPQTVIPEPEQQQSLVQRYGRFFRNTLETLMNAAVTIFGMGVGVGLILGDSLRRQQQQQQQQQHSSGPSFALESDSTSDTSYNTSPSCGSRRPSNRNVQDAPESAAAALLPAQ
jgi:hypothetical protein